jgi:hypothetical protein
MTTSKIHIVPTQDFISSHRMGVILNTTVQGINQALGFENNNGVSGDGKVKHQWNFRVNGAECSIWDYKGSAAWGQFSFYGPRAVFVEIFGEGNLGE